jgi:hypothetical protein
MYSTESKNGIFVRTKVVSPSKFECDFNTLIFTTIGHELSELRQFYKMYPEMEILYAFGIVNSCNRINIVNPSIYITAHSGITDFFFGI